MCGIAGILQWRSLVSSPEALLKRMCHVMAHRGPDADGLWVSEDQRMGLGFRRLAIVDLSAEANQPMSNEAGTLWVVFNGEIYNHAEIRRELQSLGSHVWKTNHSDTEVIVHSFEQWGIDCLAKFRGMFAIAIWDSVRQELWLIRDRLGVKPLYYSRQQGKLCFASEIKALLQDPEQARELNEEALFDFLSFLVAPAPDTLFKGINKIPAGSWLRVDKDGRTQCRRYWEPWDGLETSSRLSLEEATETVLLKLREAVQLRKVSDVPVGVFLSGGIDSSTNTVLFSEKEQQPVQTFSVGYDQEYPSCTNEFAYARLIAQKVGAHHHEVVLRQQDLIDFLPRMVELQDEPIVDPVCIPVYFVSKLARDHGVIVCQVGEGADELFCGYPFWHKILRTHQLAHSPALSWLNGVAMTGLRLAGHERSHLYERLRRVTGKQPVFWGGAEAFSQRGKELLLSPRLRARFRGRTSWQSLEPIHRRFLNGARQVSAPHWMTYLDLNLRLPELLLMRVDKMGMGASIECRVPFLDHKLVEFALDLPERFLYQPGHPKFLLKRAVAGLLPPRILNRPKQGFSVPITEWFLDLLGDQVRTTLREFARKTDYFDPNEMEETISHRRTNQMWYLFNFVLWWRRYIGH